MAVSTPQSRHARAKASASSDGSNANRPRTRFGTALYAVGSDQNAAAAAGVRVPLTRFFVYVVAGGFYGLGGVFISAQTGSGDPSRLIASRTRPAADSPAGTVQSLVRASQKDWVRPAAVGSTPECTSARASEFNCAAISRIAATATPRAAWKFTSEIPYTFQSAAVSNRSISTRACCSGVDRTRTSCFYLIVLI
jgi:hypothetical protein